MNRGKIMGWAFGLGFLIMLPMFFMQQGPGDYPELRKAVHVVRHTAAKRQIQRSSFLLLKGEKTPSSFVSWMFSTMGTAEWVVTESSGEFSPEEIKMVNKITPVIPDKVRILPLKVSQDAQMQVVVKPDDARRLILAEAYTDPGQPPVFIEELKFPTFEK